jgi:hypothetical protein
MSARRAAAAASPQLGAARRRNQSNALEFLLERLEQIATRGRWRPQVAKEDIVARLPRPFQPFNQSAGLGRNRDGRVRHALNMH